jgi:SAM-dependent methyltransferase
VPATLTPSRRRGVEYLDDPEVAHALRHRSHRDIAVANALFGGTRAMLRELRESLADAGRTATLLDVGTGTGEATALSRRFAAKHGVALDTIGLDSDPGLALSSRRHAQEAVCASALALPFADRSVDIVTCSQVLHHFHGAELATLVREMNRVARLRVIVSDLRRNWIAVAGLWIASFPLRFHPVSRHDGIVSILRGFTVAELRELVYHSVGVEPMVRRRFTFRVTASWTPISIPSTATGE